MYTVWGAKQWGGILLVVDRWNEFSNLHILGRNDFGDYYWLQSVAKVYEFLMTTYSEVGSLRKFHVEFYVNKDFQIQLRLWCRLCCQLIRSYVWKSLWNNVCICHNGASYFKVCSTDINLQEIMRLQIIICIYVKDESWRKSQFTSVINT